MDTEFFLNNPLVWTKNSSLKNALQMSSKLRIINNKAEREILLIEVRNLVLNTNEEWLGSSCG